MDKTWWTRRQKRVESCLMWRVCAALFLFVAPVWAQENATAYEALRVVAGELGHDALSSVVSVVAVTSEPQPKKWHIILQDPEARGGARYLKIAEGKLDSHRNPYRGLSG